MTTIDEIIGIVRENRSSEANFDRLEKALSHAIAQAKSGGHPTLASDLQEVAEKYGGEYRTAKGTGGTAWPEFEKFVTQFERVLTSAAKKN